MAKRKVKRKLPKHLKATLKKSMKTNRGRRNIADVIGATSYRSKSGKIVKRRRKR